ncbi:MAG: hypothetical protein IPJ36_15205 [Simplicispira sp.]|nr:hypothetical protein [Simplicispira sp.]
MLNAFVIVWRESLEAMLVIGILAAWATGRGGGVRPGFGRAWALVQRWRWRLPQSCRERLAAYPTEGRKFFRRC